MKVTDHMIYAYAGEPEITGTDAHCIQQGLERVLKELTAEELMDMLHDHGVSAPEYQSHLSGRWAEDQRKDAGL